MTDRAIRTLPWFVWVAAIASVSLHAINAVIAAARIDFEWLGMRMFIASSAMSIVTTIVLAVAIAHVGRRLTGAAAIGARIAMWALIASIGFAAIREVYDATRGFDEREASEIVRYFEWGAGLVATVGLVIASCRSQTLMLVGGALALFDELPPIVWKKLSEAAGHNYELLDVVYTLTVLFGLTGAMLLLYGATRGPEVTQPSLAVRGFRLAARGVWLRVIAAIVGVCVTFMMFAATSGSGKAIEVALVGALLVNMLSFGMFGIGAIQAACSNVDGIPRFVFGAAGVLALWCCAVMFIQAPWFYAAMAGERSYGLDFLDPLSIAQPLVATLSAAMLAAGIASFARVRNDDRLVRQARSAGVAFVCLMMFSLVAQYGLIRAAASPGGAVVVLLLAAICGLIAQIALGQLCGTASTVIDSEPTIPTAIVRP